MKTRAIGVLRRALRRCCALVLLVSDVLTPGDRAAALVVLLHGDVDHEAVRGGAVPVVLARLEEDTVAGADLLDRAALALAEADALGDEDRLAVRVRVPGGARAGREVDDGGGEGRGRLGGGDRVDVDVAREPVCRALLGLDAAAGDLHVVAPREVAVQAAARASAWVSASAAVRSGGRSWAPCAAAPRRGRVSSVTASASARKATATVSAAETRSASC